MSPVDRLLTLVDRVREIVEKTETPPWGDLWDRSDLAAQTVSMFAFPNPVPNIGLAPFVFSPDANFYARLFGYNLREVFTDARTYLCFALEQMVWDHEHLHHDSRASSH